VRFSAAQFDAAYRKARRDRVTISDVVRRALDRFLRADEKPK
jgi:hypothetical protein